MDTEKAYAGANRNVLKICGVHGKLLERVKDVCKDDTADVMTNVRISKWYDLEVLV